MRDRLVVARRAMRLLDRELLAAVLLTLAWLELEVATELATGAPNPGRFLALVVALPVAVRHRWPLAATAVSAAGLTTLVALTGEIPVTAVLPLLVCCYAVGLDRDRPAWPWPGATLGLSVLALAVLVTTPPGNVVLLAAGLAVVLALGVNVRARRDAQADLAGEGLRLREERDRRALLEERTRIARELHDVVAHAMSMIAVQAETAPYRVGPLPAAVADDYAAITATARQGLGELRGLLTILRADADLERAPQPRLADLDDLIAASVATGLPVDLAVEGVDAPVPAAVALSAYRIVQESLTNVRKHAPGAGATVTVRRVADRLDVAIADDGPGPAAPGRVGHGLLGMRERVGVLGGTLRAGPRTGGGFLVEAVLPLGEAVLPRCEEERDR